MKRLLIILLAFFMIIGITPVSAKEKAENYNWGFPETSEPAMPHYDESTSNFEYTSELREKWLYEVIEYNEKFYGQHVIKTVEEADSYWLYFETIEKESQNNIIDSIEGPEKIKYEEWSVEKIQYIKPESIKDQPAPKSTASSNITVNGTTYDYKFTYYYSWSSGYYKVQKRSFTSYLAIAADALIAYTTDGASKLVSWVIAQAAGSAFSSIDQNRPITAETYTKYFYENKVCSIKPTGTTTWYPTCQIGRRLDFGWSWSTVYKKNTNEPIILQGVAKNGNGTPPTNYDSQAKKSYYDNNTWMINKAIEMMHMGGYVDVYAVCTNLE